MNRVYYAPFQAVAVSVVQDFFEVLAATGKPVVIHQILLTAANSETNEQWTIALKRATGSYTSGSGGSTITPVASSSTMGAAATTCERNNTTQAAAGSGTLTTFWSEGIPSQGGFAWLPTPETRPVLQGSEALVVSLVNAPSAATDFNGVVVFEEL